MTFHDYRDQGRPGDEGNEIVEKGLSVVFGVVLLRNDHLERALLQCNDPEPLALDPADDLAHQPALYGIGLAEDERPFGSHERGRLPERSKRPQSGHAESDQRSTRMLRAAPTK